MIWRDIKAFPIPQAGFVIVWPTEFDVPEVWAAQTYHEALGRGPSPGWTHLSESAAKLTHWAQLPPFPPPTPAPQVEGESPRERGA